MSQQLNESKRIAQLEEIRTESNSHIIDSAIASGKTAGEVALQLLKESSEAAKLGARIAHFVNKSRNGNQ